MSRNHPLSLAAKVHVASLVAACAGFVVQIMAGVDDYPTIPPGVIVLLVAALAVVLLPSQWTPIIGVGLSLAIFVGAFFVTESTGQRLSNPDEVGAFLGTVIQMGGIVLAIVAGAVAVLRGTRVPPMVATARREATP